MESNACPELTLTPKKTRKNTFLLNFVFPAVVLGVILCLFFGGDDDNEACNLFSGQWVPKPSGPYYNNMTCNFIDDADNCLKNGRPDTEYLYWKWKPYNCDLPQFDPVKFMNAMRDKSLALIGDSILRNQMLSLICLVSQVEEPIEVYHDKSYKSRTVHFPNHNFTIATIWAPFLVKSLTDEDDDGKDKKEIQLFLDVLDTSWTINYHKYDYILISGGQWFLKTAVMWEDNKVIGCHNCRDKLVKELGVYHSYQKALQLALNFITSSSHKPLVIFRTWTPDHFEYGEWFNGGVCNRSEPYKKDQYNGSLCDQRMREIELEEYDKARNVAVKRGIKIELLDIYRLSVLRADGHPGPYRTFHPFDEDKSIKVQNDCLHWCVPGPVDTWNDLMMKILFDSEALSLSTFYKRGILDLDSM